MAKKRAKPKAKPLAHKGLPTTAGGPPVEAFAALDTWAGDVAACLPKDELGVLVGIYRRIADDGRVSADNRRLARKQAQALAKFRSK